jgi:hypothetical protein
MTITQVQTDELISRVDATYLNLIAEGIPLGFAAGEMMARGYAAIFNMTDMEIARGQISLLLRNISAELAKTLKREQRRASRKH